MPEIEANVGTEGRSVVLRFPLAWIAALAASVIFVVWITTRDLGNEVSRLTAAIDNLRTELSDTRDRSMLNERWLMEHERRIKMLEKD